VTDDYNSVSSDSAPYFFLSYAHAPRQEGYPGDPAIWVANLFGDLCSHIMQLTNMPPGAMPGFMDRELRSGSDWPARLAKALATCRVFVPLYSRRYFDSEHCGKEWFAFSRRALNHAARAGPTEAIIPALWVPVASALLPEAAKSIQFDHSQLGGRYSTHGFYGIIKLSRYRGEYEEAVYELARRIVQVAQGTRIDPEPPAEYSSLESAFGSADQPKPGERYLPDIGDLEEHLDVLLGADQTCGPGVLLVDAWASRQPEVQEKLRQLDSLDRPWIQVMIPWNRQDAEIVEADAKLKKSLDLALKEKPAAGRVDSRIAVTGVTSLEEFSMMLPVVVRVAARHYLAHAQAYPPPGPAIERPRLLRSLADPPNPEHFDERNQ
jgi:FxsC-like protein